MNKHRWSVLPATALSTILFLTGCGGDGGGAKEDDSTPTTTISGVVNLSSSAASKIAQKMRNAGLVGKGVPGSDTYRQSVGKQHATPLAKLVAPKRVALDGATVSLYNSDHPEWINPVSTVLADGTGSYTFSVLMNASQNGGAYTDGDPIPAGNYTVIATKFNIATGDFLVAVQTIVESFSGVAVMDEMTAEPSDDSPVVTAMFGQAKNTDGTNTFGNAALELAPNAAIQVNFARAMARETIRDYMVISPTIAGSWTVSADWLSATFYPDAGVSFATGTTYTVTVQGQDDYGKLASVKNVYGVPLEETMVGTFSIGAAAAADSQAPTAQLHRPTLAETASPISPATPIQIASNEIMDVNTLSLSLTPSVGAKPGVLYKGKDATTSLYIYEFILDGSMAPGETYTGQVSGGTDLAGNAMSVLNVSFSTKAAADITGVATGATTEQVNVSLAVLDAFEKWIRSINDGDISQLTSLMTGDFVFETNPDNGFDEADVNRDGVLSLKEFTDMIKFAFNVWEVCGTSLTGTVVGDVNYNATTVEADLEFTLAGTSTDKSQMCGEAAPEASSIYITLRKQNGSWMIYRASDGIDTRGEAINYAASVSIIGPADGTYFYEDPTMTIDGPAVCGDTGWDNTDGTLDPANCTVFDGAKFEWTEVTGASAYIWIVMDANNPRSGIALALPPTTFLDFADQGAFQNGALIAKEFGFETDGNGNPNFEPHPGSELLWQIAALGSNTVNAIEGGRNTDLATDIIAISKLNRAKLYGTYIPLQMEVYADTNVNGVIDVGTDTLLTFNEIFRGYDAGAADQVIVKIISPNDHATAADLDQDVGTPDAIPVMGGYAGGFGWMPLMDNTPTLHTDGTSYVGELVIPLDEGQNWAEVFDMAWVDDCGGGCPPGQARDSRQSSREQFGISTTGGRPAPVSITSITSIDSTGTSLGLGDGTATGSGDLDAWRHHNAKSGATKITIVGVASGVDYATGNMTPLNMQQLNVNLWNDRIGANAFSSVTTDTNGNFTITIKVYNGDNWINIDNCGPSGGMCNSFMSFGVYTDTGATYVPPIKITSVVETGTATELTAKDSRGNGSRYDASLVASNSITVTGTMLNFDPGTKDCTDPANQYPGGGCPWYDVGSEGGWKGGILTVQPSGEFTITANLYNGYNHISMSDTKGNWYGMEIYTSAGKPVVKPTITHYSEDGGTIWIAYTSGDIAVASCDVRIKGTAEHGELRAYWNGSFDNMGMREYFWEEKVKVVNDSHAEDIDATDGMGIFEFTVPVTSGTAAENFIDINDAQWRWTGIRASTTGSCQYTPPVMTVTGLFTVADTGFTTNLATMSDAVNGGTTAPTAETQLVIAGTTGASRDVKVETWSCGRQQFYFGTSDGAGNFAVTIDVYDGYTYYNINDGFNWGSMNIDATGNGNVAVPAMQISVADGAVPGTPLTSMNSSCDWADYDVAMAASVVITGTTEAGDGTGNYDINGVPGTFTITGGSFSFTLDSSNGLYNGYNNLNVFDTNWNGFHVNLNNVNSGATAPQFVTISSHVDGAQVVGTSGGSAVTVSGSVDLTAAAPNTYEVFKVRAMVEDCNAGNTNCTWTYFSSDSNDWQYGDMPITYDDATGNFSFSATIDSDSYTNIEVNAEGDIVDATNNRMWAGHGHRITVNDTGCTSNCGWYWKPTKVDNSVDLGRAARRLQDAARKIGKQ